MGASRGYFVRSVLLLSAGGALVLFMVSPLGVSLEEADLSFHMMVQHLGLTGGSVLVMFGGEYLVLGLIGGFRGSSLAGVVGLLYGRVILLNRRLNAGGRVLVPVVAVLLAYWHVPGNFNAAVVDEGLHGLMHVSFLVIGVLVFLCVKVLSLGQLLLYSVVLSQVMMIGGVILISTPVHLYPFYPLQQQRDAGLIMAAPHPFMVALVGVYAFSRYFWRD
ncbi:MAG: cytochrome c oxidase assembly protein [Thaumarchaeota archaeon]|nr:cytochrome c oxidase assembly protein [Nitrososphaerota archaeon]